MSTDRSSPDDYKKAIQIYKSCEKCMASFNTEFSFSAFIAVFVTMMALFWSGYKIAFPTTASHVYFIGWITTAVAGFSVQMLIMVSASITNGKVKVTRQAVQHIPYQYFAQCTELKNMLKKSFVKEVYLSLWTIYVIDGALIISSLGTLLTYGILFATFGK
ncbi:hypothetical protein AVEN_176407-1 [Araneus ventricosus]|uniref:Uncharacterized protein n=1 Tax=Araneus ventricosus TaxID=182803 RepID=A0A4Y2C931_ARAVE|nr:hypothetical protein AVEN_176407-1 [Araneus ventricosus]